MSSANCRRRRRRRLCSAAGGDSSSTTRPCIAAANAVWSLQSQEYQNLIDTSNGIIKGVIFLLLGVIPFSYFLERLVVGSSNIYRQIIWFGVIFVAMTGGLWFHPAFRISSAPIMILLAFLILILSSTVVYILWGKFEEEIARIRGTHDGISNPGGAGHVASFRRGAVLGAAVRLGLSNMRRRGMRTATHADHPFSADLHPALLHQRARDRADFAPVCRLLGRTGRQWRGDHAATGHSAAAAGLAAIARRNTGTGAGPGAGG